MASKEVEPILAKEFALLKIDIDRTIGGKDLQKRLRKDDQGGIPWFVFLDAQGNALATSDGADGKNIGFPYQPAEIEHFVTMLAKSCKRLSPEDVGVLTRSLTAVRENDEKQRAKAKAGAEGG